MVKRVVAVAALALLLAGCAYNGKANGEIGDALTFTTSADRQQELTLTVSELSPIDGGYVVRYDAEPSSTLRWADWGLVTGNGDVVAADAPPLVGDSPCGDDTDCVSFTVPSSDEVTMVRYFGVDSGYNKGNGISSDEWVGWTVK